MRRGFTLLELIIVIIIIGILATLGFTQYAKMLEKGRMAEAKAVLGNIRTMAKAYQLEHEDWGPDLAAIGLNDLPHGAACGSNTDANNTKFFFRYMYGDPRGGYATAYRCALGTGKVPGSSNQYNVTMDFENGTLEGGPK